MLMKFKTRGGGAARNWAMGDGEEAPVAPPPEEAGAAGEVKMEVEMAKPAAGAKGAEGAEGAAAEEEEEKAKAPPASLGQLMRTADSTDCILIFLGGIGALGAGCGLPLFTVLFGELMDDLGMGSGKSMEELIEPVVIWFTILGAGMALLSYLEVGMWMLTAARQARKLKVEYLRGILSQDISYFDTEASSGLLLQSISKDTAAIKNALGDKFGNTIHHCGAFLGSMILAFVYSWDMTLVLLGTLPFMIGTMAALGTVLTKYQGKATEVYGLAGGVAQESISAVRTVQSFGGEERSVDHYMDLLKGTTPVYKTMSIAAGGAMGGLNFCMMCSYGLAFWYGGMQVRKGNMTGGDVMIVLFAVLIGGFEMGQAGPKITAVVEGLGAGGSIFSVIDRKPNIDVNDTKSRTLEKVAGDIVLKGVNFRYPSRPDVEILNNFDLEIRAGKSLALVGESGSGKSTIVSLIERFYDPIDGAVTLDGVDIRELQVRWLRKQIGLVSQEPALFAMSIRENIRYGLEGASDAQVEEAAESANAHNFISALPNGYDTNVGERGVQLSGGQKQRVAIARAILKDPRILLLDEATSALDAESERIVQEALDKLMQNRTTVIVAHRLSTVKNADKIAVLQKGAVVEAGNHDDLMAKGGVFASLVALQKEGPVDIVDAVVNDADNAVVLPSAEVEAAGKDTESDKKGAKEEEKVEHDMSLLRQLNKEEWPYLFPGMLAAAVNGSVMPFWALVLAIIMRVMFDVTNPDSEKELNMWCLIFVGLGAASFIAEIVQGYCFGVMGINLSFRFRKMLFSHILKQEIGFFDMDGNTSGVLCARLAEDAASIRGAVGDVAGMAASNITTMAFALIVAFLASPKFTGILLATTPLLAVCGLLQNQALSGYGDEEGAEQTFNLSSQLASDAVTNIRTVASFGLESALVKDYAAAINTKAKQDFSKANMAGVGFGSFMLIIFWIYGFGFWIGARMIDRGELTFEELLKAFFGIVYGTMGAANVQLEFPDIEKAQEALNRVFKIINKKPTIDSSSDEGKCPNGIAGNIVLKGVNFRYPSRPDVEILNNFDLEIRAGKSLALVGESGSGKSTIVSLIERFYDPIDGAVTLDGVDIRELQVRWLRKQIGLVSQEPALFAMSIRENIRYGLEGASDAQVEEAAESANAHNFISALPNGYDTNVGERGVQLSGGQKQRVAIARAILKDPRILLLDEATSALDAESERIVQEALDKLMQNRTTVIVAHRLSTVKNADKIAVLQKGAVVEAGNHADLLARGGAYSLLVKAQMK